MQLSAPTASADFLLATLAAPNLNVAGLFAPGATPAATPGEATATLGGGEATGFAQLFPNLASGQPAAAIVASATAPADVFANLSPATAAQPAASAAPVMSLTASTATMGSLTASAASVVSLTASTTSVVLPTASAAEPAAPGVAADSPPALDGVATDETTTATLPRSLVETRPGVRAPAAPRAARHLAAARPAVAPRTAAEASLLAPPAPIDPAAFCAAPAPATEPAVAEVSPDVSPSAQPHRDERCAVLPMPSWTTPFAVDEGAPESLATETFAAATIEAPAPRPPGIPEAPCAMSFPADRGGSPAVERAAQPASFAQPVPLTQPEFPPLAAPRSTVSVAQPGAAEVSPETQEPVAPVSNPAAPAPLPAAFPVPPPPASPSASTPASDDVLRAAATVADALVSSAAARPAMPARPAAPLPRRSGGENIAAPAAKNSGVEISPHMPAQKTFLNTAAERFVAERADLGITVADSAPLMPALASNDRSAPAAVLSHAAPAVATVAPLARPDFAAPLFASAAPATAHRAVEAVLDAAERFSAGERHSVNLQFSVGGADLAVRVELRADEVRATFRTDSPELRSALAHEWQAVGADSGGRPFRLAAPVITANSADGSGLAAFAGDSAPRQRDSNPRRTASEVFASVASRARAVAAGTGVDVAVPAVHPGSLPTSLHLHTLA